MTQDIHSTTRLTVIAIGGGATNISLIDESIAAAVVEICKRHISISS